MRIDGPYDPRRVELLRKLRSTPVRGTDAAAKSDSVAISEKAKRASQAYGLVAAYRNLPDVRPDRIEQVRAKLQQGEYWTREAAEKTAESILLQDGSL